MVGSREHCGMLVSLQLGVAAYFISWAFLAGFIMMNIVLAILVDSFTEAQASLKCEQASSTLLVPKYET
jgi:hypothetical protein